MSHFRENEALFEAVARRMSARFQTFIDTIVTSPIESNSNEITVKREKEPLTIENIKRVHMARRDEITKRLAEFSRIWNARQRSQTLGRNGLLLLYRRLFGPNGFELTRGGQTVTHDRGPRGTDKRTSWRSSLSQRTISIYRGVKDIFAGTVRNDAA